MYRDIEKRRAYARQYYRDHPERKQRYREHYHKKCATDPEYYAQRLAKEKERYHANLDRSRALARERAARYLARQRQKLASRPKPDRCEICGEPENITRKFHGELRLDHCHKSGKFRGWLCSTCNRVLGCVRDDVAILRKMIIYLEANR